MSRPLAVVVGFIGKQPVAGMSLYNLHYIVGLRELGYDVHFVERQNRPYECYDPVANALTDSPEYAVRHVEAVLGDIGMERPRFSFIDRQDRCHGSGWPALRSALRQADFVLTLADETWFDELSRCPRRAFLDGDPVFTQARMEGDPELAAAIAHYDTLFTIGVRIGTADCTIPTAGRTWIPARSVVATRLWDVAPPAPRAPVTTLMHWKAAAEVSVAGRDYGHKNREMERFIDLPGRTAMRMVLAVGGAAPKSRLRERGWQLVDPIDATRTIPAYRAFIAGSRLDLGIAKHAYVASRSGWFSDRSTCFLAAGRPVLHQDTGFPDWLPTGKGVLSFATEEEAVEGLTRIASDHEAHALAAREIAEEYFEARKVLGEMLDRAGFR